MYHLDRFAADRDLDAHAVGSNMHSCLDMLMLQAHYKRYVDEAWDSSVGHVIGLLSLCAPLSYPLGLETLYIAFNHTAAFEQPWGAHPEIDDRIRWTHSAAVHDGYELSRQEKIELIADYVDETGRTFPIRTCVNDDLGGNCSHCEKCYRTMCGMVLAGLNPNEFGYEMDERTFARTREALDRQAFVMDDHTVFHWLDLQRKVSVDRDFPVEGAREFFEWLRDVDVESIGEPTSHPHHEVLLRTVARNIPYPIYRGLYPVYGAVKKHVN